MREMVNDYDDPLDSTERRRSQAVVACNVTCRPARRERIRTLVGSEAKQPRKADDLYYA